MLQWKPKIMEFISQSWPNFLATLNQKQEERLKQRLERRRQLKEERSKEGLVVDDETLDEIVEKEEKRRDFLEDRKKKRVSYLWIFITNKVHRNRPQTIQTLKQLGLMDFDGLSTV